MRVTLGSSKLFAIVAPACVGVTLLALAGVQPAGAQTSGLPADSLRARGIHPVYNTSFDVFKARTDWRQTLSLNQSFGDAQLNTSLTSSNVRDVDQSDLDRASAAIRNRLTYSLFGGVDVGFVGNLDRSRSTITTSNQNSESQLFRLTSGWAPAFRDSTVFVTMNGEAGVRESNADNAITTGLSPRRSITRQSGPSLKGVLGFTNDRPAPPSLTFDLDLSIDAFRQETQQRTDTLATNLMDVVGSEESVINATNSTRTASAAVGWAATSSLDFDVDVRQSVSSEIRPGREAQLENRGTDARSAGFLVHWRPGSGWTLALDLDASEDDKTSELQQSANQLESESAYSIDVDGKLLGVALEVLWEQSSQQNQYRPLKDEAEATLPDRISDLVHTNVKAKRDLSSQLDLSFTFDLALDQSFYAGGTLDVDRQDRTSDLLLTYKPSANLSGGISFTESRARTVNLSRSSAGNTNTQQRVTVGANYVLRVRTTTIRQVLTIGAQSRTFDFADADQSDLSRTNELKTTIDIGVTGRTRVKLDHRYSFRNSGRYARNDLGVRVFSLNQEISEQTLDASVSYDPRPWLKFQAIQQLRVDLNRSPGSEGNRRTQYELELFGQFNKRLVHDVQSNFRVTRVLSTREDNYWRAELTANKAF